MNRMPANLFAVGAIAVTCLAAGVCSAQRLPNLVPETETEIRSDDLIRLTDSFSEAVANYRSAELRFQTLKRLSSGAGVTGLEVQLAEINVQSARNRVEILHAIGKKMLALAESRAAFVRRLEQEGELPPGVANAANPRLIQVESDLRILNMILAMYPFRPAPVEPTAPRPPAPNR